MSAIGSLDRSLYHDVLYAPHPSWLTSFMVYVTRPENFFLAIVVAALFLVVSKGGRGRFLVISAGVGIAISDPLTSFGIKSLFHRPRPCHGEDPSRLPLGCSDSFSFPSSHGVNIFCEATIVSLIYPKAAPYANLFAALVGYSRVYLGVHYPFDVIGGAGIGILIGWGVVAFLGRVPALATLLQGGKSS